jgi:uncharacterized protein (TIGR02594 family)
MAIALGEAGVKERAVDKDNPRILEYLETVTPPTSVLFRDSTPWCSAFVNWVLRQAFPGRYNGQRARARAWLKYGLAVPIEAARFGDIVIVERGIPGVGGHVAFFMRYHGNKVVLFGGNQRNAVCEAEYPRRKIMAVRRVIEV